MGRPPVWHRIEAALSEDLATGRYAAGDKLPTEAELTARFGVSRNTVRKALTALEAAGEVHLRHGAGAFAAQRAVHLPLTPALETVRAVQTPKRPVRQTLVALSERPAAEREAATFQIMPGTPLLVCERRAERGAEALWLAIACVPAARMRGLEERLHLGETLEAAVGDLMSDGAGGMGALGQGLRRTWTGIDARNALPEQADQLGIRERDALLHATSVVTDRAGRVVLFDEMWCVTGRVVVDLGSRGVG